jgi:hypothetical protein
MCTGDLLHARTVKPERHHQFAAMNAASAFFVSAKIGDAVTNSLVQIACDLLGIGLKRPEGDLEKVLLSWPVLLSSNSLCSTSFRLHDHQGLPTRQTALASRQRWTLLKLKGINTSPKHVLSNEGQTYKVQLNRNCK